MRWRPATGWPWSTVAGELRPVSTSSPSALAGVGHDVSSIHDIYVTHIHRDHYTLAVELRRRFGTRVHLGRDEAPGLHELLEIASNVPVTSLHQLRRSGEDELAAVVEAMTESEEFDADGWEKPDVWLDPGEYAVGARVLEAVATPGHTKGHLVYHDLDAGILFSGDHLLPTISPSIGFELGDWELPLASYLSSLEAMLAATRRAAAPRPRRSRTQRPCAGRPSSSSTTTCGWQRPRVSSTTLGEVTAGVAVAQHADLDPPASCATTSSTASTR